MTEQPWHRVRVTLPDGHNWEDGIRGANPDEAIDNAKWNWGKGSPAATGEPGIEYLGPDQS